MIDLHAYLLFIGAVVVLVLVPGPDMAYMLARTIAQGRKAGFLAVAGINAGAYVHVAAAVVGLSAILATSSLAFAIVKWAGACYLVFMGVQAILAKSSRSGTDDGQVVAPVARTIFWQGFWSDVLNPKVAIFFLAFLPQFVDVGNPHATVAAQLLLLGVTCNVVALGVNLLLVQFASLATNGLRMNEHLVAWLKRAMGGVFVALGLRLASERT